MGDSGPLRLRSDDLEVDVSDQRTARGEEAVVLSVTPSLAVRLQSDAQELDPLSPATPAVVRAKLRPAVNPVQPLRRPRLHALLDEGVRGPLTLVVAPAGSGKTSLLRAWSSETPLPVAWLSLDEGDSEPVLLWQAVVTALDGLAPGCAAAVAEHLVGPNEVLEAVRRLLDDLEVRDLSPRVLVIDDLHLVDEGEGIATALALFVQHLPAWLHVVVASRRSLRLPLHRLRARGVVSEVRFQELRFSLDEAAAVLAQLSPSLDADVLGMMAERAAGWAASIRLTALAVRATEAQGQRFAWPHEGDMVSLEDYLWREVLADEREDVMDVLMAIAVAERVDADLAQVLTGRPDAQDLLTLAEERGLFVYRAEPSGFEMHPQVRGILVAAMAARSPDRLRQLNARTAEWHEEHGHIAAALEHWLRAGRPGDALALLAAQALELYEQGQAETIARILKQVPATVVTDDLDVMIDYSWPHLFVDRNRFLDLVDGMGRLVRGPLAMDPVRRARIEILRSIAATLRGHWDASESLARSALQDLGDIWSLDPIGQFAWNTIARDIALSDRWEDAGQGPDEVMRELGVAPERRTALEGTRALAEALSGRPVDALRLAAGVQLGHDGPPETIVGAEVKLAEAIAHRELGDLAAALPMLSELVDARVEPAPHCTLLALMQLAHARVDQGDLERGADAFGAMALLVEEEMPGPGARDWLARTGTILALSTHDVEDARSWSSQVVDPFWSAIGAARVLLATGEPDLASEALKSAEPRCLRHQVITDLLLFRAQGGALEAEEHLFEAVRLASGHGLVQTVASEGQEIVEAVERLAWRIPQPWIDRLRRAGQPVTPSTAAVDLKGPIEPLTERELVVLRMLPSRLTLREISDELFISINTLKFHLKVIYRKLGCSSRAEAASWARSFAGLHKPPQPWSTRRR